MRISSGKRASQPLGSVFGYLDAVNDQGQGTFFLNRFTGSVRFCDTSECYHVADRDDRLPVQRSENGALDWLLKQKP